MILLAVFGGIVFLIVAGFFIGRLCEKEFSVGLLVASLILMIVTGCGIYFQMYGVKRVKETVTTYNTYRIELDRTTIEFPQPVRVKRTATRYPLYTIIEGSTLYEILGPATE